MPDAEKPQWAEDADAIFQEVFATPLTQDRGVPIGDMAQAFATVFRTPAGRKVLAHLRSTTVEAPTWNPGLAATYGYFREGQNELVRHIERILRNYEHAVEAQRPSDMQEKPLDARVTNPIDD